jgi:ENTS family enterobactin (siderophore) exporter
MRLGQLVVDLTPARQSREFRLLLACRTIVLLSAGFIAVAAPVQVYRLTGSSLQIGLVSLAFGLSLLCGLLAGGVLADRVNRRGLILFSSTGVALAFGVFALNAAFSSPAQLLIIYLTVLIGGVIEGIGQTALSAVTPALVAPNQLAAASGLIAITSQLGAIAGPALGGIVLAAAGLPGSYGAAALAIVLSTALLTRLPELRPAPADAAEQAASGPVRSLLEGFTFVRRNRLIAGILLIDLCATGFGIPQTLFPQLVAEQFHGGPEMVGMLAAAPAAGALLASITSGWTGRVRRSGAALIGAVLLMGAAYIAFGLAENLLLALLFLAIIGGADCASEILRRALLQHHTPDRLQGRVSSLWLAQSGTSYALGSTTSGFTASLFGPALAIIGAGALCITTVSVLATTLPQLRRARLTTTDSDVTPGTADPLAPQLS